MGVFTFSPEEGTKAYQLSNQVPEEIKESRRDALMEIQQPIAAKKNKAEIGKVVEVLIEQENPTTGELIGRSARFAPEVDGLVYIKGQASLGSIVSVKITDADTYDLYGEVLSN
jgi:ribosomal protein S12 methylthiotransferase